MYKEEIKGILKRLKGNNFDFEQNLITDGYISSFDLIALIAEMEKQFFVRIPLESIQPESFNNLDSICELIMKYK